MDIGDQATEGRTRSDLEKRLLALCRRHGLSTPEVNVMVAGHRADFLWQERKLIVEVDSWLYHRGRGAFQDDRARDAHHATLGYQVVRFTDYDVDDDDRHVVKTISSLLRG